MAAPVLQFKRGEFANLPALKAGEPGFTTDKYDLYVGLDNNLANNKFFGSHRYWTKETSSTGSGINLVEGTSNGTSYVTLSAPSSVGAAVTYYLPSSQGASSSVLTNDGSGNLTWSSGSENATFTGITTFSDTTDNTLGNSNTGSVLFDGGVGIDKNLTIGGNLNVQGYSEFVGVVTFKGGTINIGDQNTDDINVAGEFISDLIPNTDNTYSLGTSSQQWKNLYINGHSELDTVNISGIATFTGNIDASSSGGATIDNIQIAISNDNEIDTTVGNLTLDSAGGTITLDDNIAVSGISTFSSNIDANGDLDVDGHTELDNVNISGITTFSSNIDANGDLDVDGFTSLDELQVDLMATLNAGLNVTGVSTFSTDILVGGDIRINGNDIKSSDGNTNISLTSNTLTTFAGDIRVNGNDIQSSDGQVNITLTSNTLTEIKGDLQVTGNDIKSSGGSTAITLSGGDVTVAGDITVGGNDIKASDGTTAITLTDVTGNVGISSDLTISGNLYVNGSTTQVNTTTLTVEDSIIEVGLIDGNPPGSDLNKDLGLVFHYYTVGPKKASVFWDESEQRIVIAANVSESSSVLTISEYASVEFGSLWVNDCAGQSQVISCTGTERFLENITIDGGSF